MSQKYGRICCSTWAVIKYLEVKTLRIMVLSLSVHWMFLSVQNETFSPHFCYDYS